MSVNIIRRRCFGTVSGYRRLPKKERTDLPTAAESNARQAILDEAERASIIRGEKSIVSEQTNKSIYANAISRKYNAPAAHLGTSRQQIYPGDPHNFASLRPIPQGFDVVARAVRERPWESRFDLFKRVQKVKFCNEPEGTPRKELQDGMVSGIRVRRVQNPYVKITPALRYQLDNWDSHNYDDWNPHECWTMGSRRRYKMPEDISPHKDELGEWHPPRLNAKYRNDIQRQYEMHGIPWVWEQDFYRKNVLHYADREPKGPKHWYKKELRQEKIKAALLQADQLVEDYRKAKHAAKRRDWFDSQMLEFLGEDTLAPYVKPIQPIPKGGRK